MDISVIVPTYKPGDYIQACLLSLAHQNFAASNYEIIVVLNGCCNPYLSSLERFVETEGLENVRIIQTDIPGVSNARNIGLDNASGKYVLFVDDDDWVSGNYMQNLLSIVSDNAVACSNVVLKDSSSGVVLPYFLSSAYTRCRGYSKRTLFNSRSYLSSVCCKLIPVGIIGNNRFDATHKLGEDALFMFMISDRIKNITLSSEDTIYYVRARENSASRKHYTFGKRLKVALRLSVSYIAVYIQKPFSYDFWLFASRIFATLIKLRKKEYV